MVTRYGISVEIVRQCLEYKNGELYWRERPREHFTRDRSWRMWNNRYPGVEAGFPQLYERDQIYRWVINLFNRPIFRSILVWTIHHDWPPAHLEVDHIDSHDTLNDNIENLRLATPSQQGANHRKSSRNTSGYKGVSWQASVARWKAEITVNRKRIYLGLYNTVEEAAAAYRQAAIEHFGEYACFD